MVAEPDSGALKEGLTLLGAAPLAQTQPWKTGMMRYIAPSVLDPSIPALSHTELTKDRRTASVEGITPDSAW